MQFTFTIQFYLLSVIYYLFKTSIELRNIGLPIHTALGCLIDLSMRQHFPAKYQKPNAVVIWVLNKNYWKLHYLMTVFGDLFPKICISKVFLLTDYDLNQTIWIRKKNYHNFNSDSHSPNYENINSYRNIFIVSKLSQSINVYFKTCSSK